MEMSLLTPASLPRQLLDMRRLYDGHIEKVAGSRRLRITELEATARQQDEVFIDLDGELSGTLPARFQLLPRTLHVRGGWIKNPLLEASRSP